MRFDAHGCARFGIGTPERPNRVAARPDTGPGGDLHPRRQFAGQRIPATATDQSAGCRPAVVTATVTMSEIAEATGIGPGDHSGLARLAVTS